MARAKADEFFNIRLQALWIGIAGGLAIALIGDAKLMAMMPAYAHNFCIIVPVLFRPAL
jgi:hypothetical protein